MSVGHVWGMGHTNTVPHKPSHTPPAVPARRGEGGVVSLYKTLGADINSRNGFREKAKNRSARVKMRALDCTHFWALGLHGP